MATDGHGPLFNREARPFRYYRNEVERHWDPGEIELRADRTALAEADDTTVESLCSALAKFGAGERSVTEDLAPLAVVSEEIEDQAFLATQLYEEAKHTDFFDRYWHEVIDPTLEERELPKSSPTDPRWFDDDYEQLFERQERALSRLLTDDTPENRARAYTHYHLVVEGIFAQTGYYGLHAGYSQRHEETPTLPGLVEGLFLIRGDEGRHVGFGIAKLRELIQEEGIDPALISETVEKLVALVQGSLADSEAVAGGASMQADLDPTLEEYALQTHAERMQQITDETTDIPDVEDLTRVESE